MTTALVVYESMFGATRRAALAIANGLFVGGVDGGLLDGEVDRAREWAARFGASLTASAGAHR